MRLSNRLQIGCVSMTRRGGQVLLVAVLLMLAILLIGILFVALVTYNQSQSARHEDQVVAQGLAEAAIRFADEQLQTSVLGADWRPPLPPAQYADGSYDSDFDGPDGMLGTEDDYYTDDEIARGWAPLREGSVGAPGGYRQWGFTRYPDPRQPAGTPALAGNTLIGRGYFLLRVTYDPDPPYEGNEPRVPDPMSRHVQIEAIGRVVDMGNVWRKLVAYKPLVLTDYARFVGDTVGSNSPAQLGIPSYVDMDNNGTVDAADWLETVFEGPVKINGLLQLYGNQVAGAASTKFDLVTEANGVIGQSDQGYLRDDAVEASGSIEVASGCDAGSGVYVDTNPEVTVLSSGDAGYDSAGGRLRDGTESAGRFCSPLAAPALTTAPEQAGMERYRKLTRDSGEMFNIGVVGSEEYVNTGQWGHGAGVYVDNFNDVQFMQANGNHDLDALLTDWQRPMGAGGTPPPDSGWNAIMTNYSPPGVEVEFYPTATAVGAYSTTLPVGAGEVWWPNHDGVNDPPGIKLTRHDQTWRTDANADSGQYAMVVDFPTQWVDGTAIEAHNPVVFAEGNMRVSGTLPRALRLGPGAGLQLRRAYDLTIVSNATIYVDGELLSPQDIDGRAESATGYDPTIAGSPVIDEDNTGVALLARDCVCLNATQIVPQLTTGLVSAAPDDPTNINDPNRHWELSPGSGGRCYSTWTWGQAPVAGGSINVVAYQTAADPGPSGMSLTTWNGTLPYIAHVFGAPPAPLLNTTFLFVPAGITIPGEATAAPYPYCSTTLAPLWEEHARSLVPPTPLPPPPNLPWDVTAALAAPVAGERTGVILRHQDPGLSAGSTNYWLKKWKIEELNAADEPVGAIHARVSAAVYAERGCWYVLAPEYFDDSVTGADAERFRRYNYDIEFTGTIAENFTAPLAAVRSWIDRTAYPATYTGGSLTQWGTVRYNFAEALRIARDQGPTSLAAASTPPRATAVTYRPATVEANLPKLPLLPVSPDLIYYGEAQ